MAEYLYGTTLRLPAQFFTPRDQMQLPNTNFVTDLSQFMTTVRYKAPRSPTNRKVHVDPRLLTCSHVFVRNDAIRKPLDRPYRGPFKVVSRFKNTLFWTIALIKTASALIVWNHLLSICLRIYNLLLTKTLWIQMTDIPKAWFSVISISATMTKIHQDKQPTLDAMKTLTQRTLKHLRDVAGQSGDRLGIWTPRNDFVYALFILYVPFRSIAFPICCIFFQAYKG